MKIKRLISSIPLRTSESTWDAICELITGDGSVDTNQLDAAASVLHSLITDEIFEDAPITLTGVSHRLIINLRYRQAAIEEGDHVDEIQWNPTAGDWQMYVPCDEASLPWAKKALANRAPRIILHKLDERPYDAPASASNSAPVGLQVDWGVLD